MKSTGPMVVQAGESRSVPVFWRPGGRKSAGPLLYGRFIGARSADPGRPTNATTKMSKKTESRPVLERWIERDLTRAAAEGALPASYEIDDLVEYVGEIVSAGKYPILSGDSATETRAFRDPRDGLRSRVVFRFLRTEASTSVQSFATAPFWRPGFTGSITARSATGR